MNIEEMQHLKRVTEHAIRFALREFEKSTGLQVYSVGIERLTCDSVGHARSSLLGRVLIDVQL